MNEEKFQRLADFIVEQQAKFSADIAKLEEDRGRFERQTSENFAKLGDIILSLANYNHEQDVRIAANAQTNRGAYRGRQGNRPAIQGD
jgi:hypothetical protein